MSDRPPSGDPAERHFSPPPPSGFRERLAVHRGTLFGMAVVAAVVAAIAVAVLLAAGDGKGSGDIERAFGRLSQEDEQRMIDAQLHHTGAANGLISMIESTAEAKLDEATEYATQSEGSLESAAGVVDSMDNETLRGTFRELTATRLDFVESYQELFRYVRTHRSRRMTPEARAIVAEVRKAARAMVRADQRLLDRVEPYMTPEQRGQMRRAQAGTAARLKRATGE
jgi:hypothetical protein